MTEYLLIEDTQKFNDVANKPDAHEFLQSIVLDEASKFLLSSKDMFKLERRDNSVYLQIEDVEKLIKELLEDTLQKVMKRFVEENKDD